jgi:hypothetical protein
LKAQYLTFQKRGTFLGIYFWENNFSKLSIPIFPDIFRGKFSAEKCGEKSAAVVASAKAEKAETAHLLFL